MILITPSNDKKKYRLANNIDFYGTFIPEGFEFDGASVPRFFWRIVSPFQPWVIRAACGHDYLYENAIGMPIKSLCVLSNVMAHLNG